MATQICPKCCCDSFSWHIDEEDNGLTSWGCFNCGYSAYEDETMTRQCPECRSQTDSSLKDENGTFWWCSNCNRICSDN